jgi:hypothetical protein
MRRISLLFALCFAALPGVFAQVVSPVEIKDHELRALQERYMDDLKKLGADVLSIPTEYSFYLSRRLDLDEQKQKASDQRSIRFDRYKGRIVIEITGNYFAAYSTDKLNADQRARETFRNIVLPILKLAVTRFQGNPTVQGYAFEISHHILGKVMGVSMERPENLVVVLPQPAAIRLVASKDENVQQSALLQGEVYLNANPVTIWLKGEGPQLAAQAPAVDPDQQTPAASNSVSAEIARGTDEKMPGAIPAPTLKPAKPADPPAPVRDTSPQALASLQASRKEDLAGMVKELDPQAHFVSYAPPSFIAFRKGVYLELSINTSISEAPGGSRYKLAALAFDNHVAHLIRPVLGYVKDDSQFDGIGFSTNLHLAGKAGASTSPEAVEFFFPFSALRCYEHYDCTGQQLIDAGTVLINGERVSLDLQIAEGGASR